MTKKNSSPALGEFIVPVIDLLSILFVKTMESFSKIIVYGINKFILNKEETNKSGKIDRNDLSCQKKTFKYDSLGYSVNNKRNIFINELDKSTHTLTCGASGFGKSVLLDVLLYDDLRLRKPVIFIDPKGDYKSLEKFIDLCKITGRKYSIFSEIYHGPGKIDLNPYKEGSATHIADRVHYSFTWSEEHYEVLCYNALKKACNKLVESNKTPCVESIRNTILELSDPLNKKSPFKRSDIQGIILRLENIIDTDLGCSVSSKGHSFKEIWQRKDCVYIGLPVLGFPQAARSLGKMILGDLSYLTYNLYKNMTVEFEKTLHSTGIYIDELSAIITNDFIEIVNKCRGAKIELNLAFQSPADINKICPDLCEQLFENTSNWFILKQRLEKSAEMLSEAIGTATSKKETIRVQDGEELSEGSVREVEQLIVHPNIIKNLNKGQSILLRHSPTMTDLINIKYINPQIIKDNLNYINKGVVIEKQKEVKKQVEQCRKAFD